MNNILSDNNYIPRMRTISEAARELKKIDGHSAVSEYYIKCLCLKGVVPTVKAGRKILVNFDMLLEFFRDPTNEKFLNNKISDLGFRRIT